MPSDGIDWHGRRHRRCRCRHCLRRRARLRARRAFQRREPVVSRPWPASEFFFNRPEFKLVASMAHALFEYVQEKLGPFPATAEGELADLGTEDLKARIAASIKDDLETPDGAGLWDPAAKSDERQEGRSEVVREIADPRQS